MLNLIDMKTAIELRAEEKDRSTMALAASRELSRGGRRKEKTWIAAPDRKRTSRLSLCFLAVMNATVISPCAAQLGSTVCACSPPEIEITFDFSVTCNDTNVANNTGIAETECNVSPFQGGVAIDEVPVVISTIDVVELDRFNGVLKSSSVFQEFLSGDTFKYVTTSANVSGVDPNTVPGGWQFSMIGSNAQQQPLLLMWIIKFTNDCESYPVLFDGDKIAWSVFTNLTEPDASICPAIYSNSPTESPTSDPLGVPTPNTFPPLVYPTRPPTTSSQPPTPVTPPNGTQPPDGCYWAGPAYLKSGKGKGKGVSKESPKTKKQHSKKTSHLGKSSKKSSSTKTAKGSQSKGAYMEDVFTEYPDEDNYHYDNDYGDWYWCPPGYEHEATTAPSWPKGSGTSTTGGSNNPRPMDMQTAQTQSSFSNGATGGDYGANAPEGSIQSQNTPGNNYWATRPNGDTTSSGGGDYYSYTPGSSSHPDSGAAGAAGGGASGLDPYGAASTRGLPPPPTTTTTSNTSSSGAPTAILIAAVTGGSVLALIIGFVVRRKLIYGDEEDDDGGGDKVVVQTQSGDHSVSTIGGGSRGGDNGGGGGGPPMQV